MGRQPIYGKILNFFGKTYKMVVNTLPKVVVSNIRILQNKENIISAKTPQGSIIVKEQRGYKLENVECIIKKAGSCKTLNVQRVREKEKYLVGKYDIEIHTLPITYYKNISLGKWPILILYILGSIASIVSLIVWFF